MRIAAAQPKTRFIDYRLRSSDEVLLQVDKSLTELEEIVHRAGAVDCDALALPEDTLGLISWEADNPSLLEKVLPKAVEWMLGRLGAAAAGHKMYLACCSDTVDADGALRNTAFLLGRDGKEIGRYYKVNMPIHELHKKRGDSFPVFHTPDLGDVGMLICYDMVFPEAPRCLALGGADLIFHPTLGGAAIGDGDISIASSAFNLGSERFKQADALLKSGKLDEAKASFESLRKEFPTTWIDRVSQQRLVEIQRRTGDSS